MIFSISIWMKSALQIFRLSCTCSGCVLFLCGAWRVPLDLKDFLRLKCYGTFLTYLGVVARRGFFLWYYLRLTLVLSHSGSSFFTSVYRSSRTAERISVSFDIWEVYGKVIALLKCSCKSWNFNEHFSWKLLAFLLGSCALCLTHWTRTQVRKIRLDFILFKFNVPKMETCCSR